MAKNKRGNPFSNTNKSVANTPTVPTSTVPNNCAPGECGTTTGPFPEPGIPTYPTTKNKGKTTTGSFPGPTIPTMPPVAGLPLGIANQILGVNVAGTALEYKTLVAGLNITITHASGQIVISSTELDNGTVTSVSVSSSTLYITGSPITTSGTVHVELQATGVTPGNFTAANITVDGYGRILAVTNGHVVTSVSVSSSTLHITGSPITTSGTVDVELQATGVTAGHFTSANITVDSYGRILTASSSSAAGEELYAENPQVGHVSPTAMGLDSVAIGDSAIAGADKSLAIGEQSFSRIAGGVVQANGRFASSGDAQIGKYIVRAITTSNAPAQGYPDGPGGSINLVLVDNSTWTFRITVTAQRTDTPDGRAGFELKGVVYRLSGVASVAIQGIVSKQIYSTNNSDWNVVATADTVNGSLAVTFYGELGKNIRWVALVETVEVTN